MDKTLQFYEHYFDTINDTIDLTMPAWREYSCKYDKTPVYHSADSFDDIVKWGLKWLNKTNLKNHKTQHIRNMISDVIENKILDLLEIRKFIDAYLKNIDYYLSHKDVDHASFLKDCANYAKQLNLNDISLTPQHAFKIPEDYLRSEPEGKTGCLQSIHLFFCHPYHTSSYCHAYLGPDRNTGSSESAYTYMSL